MPVAQMQQMAATAAINMMAATSEITYIHTQVYPRIAFRWQIIVTCASFNILTISVTRLKILKFYKFYNFGNCRVYKAAHFHFMGSSSFLSGINIYVVESSIGSLYQNMHKKTNLTSLRQSELEMKIPRKSLKVNRNALPYLIKTRKIQILTTRVGSQDQDKMKFREK